MVIESQKIHTIISDSDTQCIFNPLNKNEIDTKKLCNKT